MSFEILGLSEFMAALDRVAADVDVGTKNAIVRMAAAVEDKAKQNASGDPGPEVKTGTMRRGIRHQPVRREGLTGWRTEVGPTVIYSRRKELGFHGEDAIGRVYNQEGRPYFTPAWNEVAGRMRQIYAEEWRKALTRL